MHDFSHRSAPSSHAISTTVDSVNLLRNPCRTRALLRSPKIERSEIQVHYAMAWCRVRCANCMWPNRIRGSLWWNYRRMGRSLLQIQDNYTIPNSSISFLCQWICLQFIQLMIKIWMNCVFFFNLTQRWNSLERPTVVFGDAIFECNFRARHTANRSIETIADAPVHISQIELLETVIKWRITLENADENTKQSVNTRITNKTSKLIMNDKRSNQLKRDFGKQIGVVCAMRVHENV